jgi:hypothetical protein
LSDRKVPKSTLSQRFRILREAGLIRVSGRVQKQKRAELERHRGGRFNLDDREMLSQARDLASSHGYTVLQAIQEWHNSKGSSKAMPLGQVIEKFLAAKSNRSPAYMD